LPCSKFLIRLSGLQLHSNHCSYKWQLVVAFQTFMFANINLYVKPMKNTTKKKKKKWTAEKSEEAMIQGILEGSPEAIGVAVVRLNCGCRKMAAVDKDGEPASKVIMFRDRAESICAKCKEDNGSFMRMAQQFIHWSSPEPEASRKKMIEEKVLGIKTH